jgi:aerobic C4-dicarboxylate transport protein
MLLGILAGVLIPHQAVALRPLGDLLVRLIRMTLPPLMFLSITAASRALAISSKLGELESRLSSISRLFPRWR